MSRYRYLAQHWPLIIAASFSVFTLILIGSLYSAQSQLRIATDGRLIADGQRRASAVADFLGERRQVVHELANSHEIAAYQINRALGMSPKHGLNLSLDAIKQRFSQQIKQKTLRGRAVYQRIVFLGEDGAILAEAGNGDQHDISPARPENTPYLLTDSKSWRLVASAPVIHDGIFAGEVVTISDLRLLSRLLFSSKETAAGRYQEALITGEGIVIPAPRQSTALSANFGRALSGLPESQLIDAVDISGAEQFTDTLMLRTAITGSSLSLLTLTSRTDAYGQLLSPAYLLFLVAFSSALLIAAFGFERMRKRAIHFQLEYAESDRYRTELEQRNQAISAEILRRQTAECEINQLAFYDQLTGLPNRRLLINRLQQALAASSRHQRQGALLYLDLDNFKSLNDTLGHDIGDLLLLQVAQRLSGCVRENDTVARLGGDEFVVVLEDLSKNLQEASTQAKIVGEKILSTLNQNYQLARYQQRSTFSIGIALFLDGHEPVEELLRRADLAMYQAKTAGRNTLRFFDPAMQAAVTARAALDADLRRAIEGKQFVLYYQAQVDFSGRVIGVEALLRWQHPQRGMVSPAEFIPLAEETRLILPIGQWVLETACERLAAWATRPELAHLTVAVNVSARQLHHRDFVDQVLAALGRSGANPQRLKLELTESLLVDDVEDVIGKMTGLKAKGVGFSLDDFGTGYSSLSYLKRLPLDQLKIDQSFVRNILTDANDAAIAKMVIALGDSLGLAVIAEGVETGLQKEFLALQGCHAYQGYFFSRPLAIDSFEQFALR